MKKSDLSKAYYQKLRCRVFILGASDEGESILFIVYGDEKIIYSCITDSFKNRGTNVPDEIANMYGLNQVTDIFWTHPHDDHSDGLIELIEKYKPEYVYIPSDLQMLPDDFPTISKSVLEKINQYHSCDRRFSYQPCVEDIGGNHIILNKTLHVADKMIPFVITAVAPMIGRVRRDVITGNYEQLNDFSIVLSIVVGDFAMLLTGDIEDRMIRYVLETSQAEVLSPNLLKIPHHGSKGSLEISSLFDAEALIDVAVSTAKKSSRLPIKAALDNYNTYCDRVYSIRGDKNDVGIWGVEIDILKATITEIEIQNYMVYENT